MAGVFESLLNNTFTVERKSRTGDGHGNFPLAWSAFGTVEGRIRPANSREQEVAAQQEREISHVLYVLDGTDIARGDRVTCGELVVEVVGVREPSLMGHHLEVDCVETQAEETT